MFVFLFAYLGGGVWFSPNSVISEKKIPMQFKINVYLCVWAVGLFIFVDICFMGSGFKNNLLRSCFGILKMKLFIFLI